MIRYTLKCDQDHAFESWFHSAAAFESVAQRNALACPECGSSEVAKALMSPTVGSRREGPSRGEILARLRRKLETESDYVGDRFASESRAIHAGDAPERSIWGEARLDEARSLIEEGIPIAPIPFTPDRKMN